MKTPITYYGGKQRMTRHILPLMPPHDCYVEPFFGGGAIFFAKHVSHVEVINDIDGNLINFFRVLQDRKLSYELRRKLRYTLYSRDEYILAREMLVRNKGENLSNIDKAWCYFILTRMSFACKFNGGFGYSKKCNEPKNTENAISRIYSAYKRLKNTIIENDCAIKVIERYDSPKTLFYLDPPYIDTHQCYKHKINDDFLVRLKDTLNNIKGKYILSGYNDYGLENIKRVETIKASSSAKNCTNNTDRDRTEYLTMNFSFNEQLTI